MLTRRGGKVMRVEKPLEQHPDLFTTFAIGSGSNEDFVAFANSYGSLVAADGRPERLSTWREAHRSISGVLDVLHTITSRDLHIALEPRRAEKCG